jgi:ATP phosphoribosyltransferase regulatory subunit
VEEKNIAGLEKAGLEEKTLQALKALLSLSGPAAEVLPRLKEALAGLWDITALTRLEAILDAIEDPAVRDSVRVDFSTVSDMHYYNGIVFKGFVEGVPTAVLSGGQYDKLMRKMGRRADAIGFAVYPDLLQHLPGEHARANDADVLLLYTAEDAPAQLHQAVRELTAQGLSVRCATTAPDKMTFGRTMHLCDLCGKE